MKKELVKVIEDSLKALGLETIPSIEAEVPPNDSMGDLATPVAMSIAALLKKSPRKIAEELINSIKDLSAKAGKSAFEKIDIAGPGFINFTFSKEYLYSEIKKLIEYKSGFLREDIGKGRRVQIEFISANPTGPLHLGHGRGGATGEALSNLLNAAGYKVEREYYINDAGKQVKLLGLSVFARYQQLLGIEYPFPEEGYKGGYIEDVANEIIKENGKKFLQRSFEAVSDFFIDYSYRMILSGIKKDLKDFGINFDTWQSEEELYKKGDVEEAIEDLKIKGFIYEKDGATWFRSTAFGDDKDRVIIKQDGEYTYFTSDIAYHKKKIEKTYDELIDIWGADHHGYIPRVKAVIEALGYPKEKLKVLLVQMVNLLRGGKPVQMSKRAGEFVTLREVMNEVGPDTTKFIFLTRRPDSHLDFDLEVAKAQSSENPVFYVQYANARINSIFTHAKEKGINTDRLYDADLMLLSVYDELRIIRKLLIYPMVFEGAVNTYEPHRITFYLQEISGMFHPYYNKFRVVSDDIELTRARLALCGAIRIVLQDGLEILGISAPEKM
ncbi:MAG: arginine--tRNA ligase [Nitrospirae bacterium CG_4_10_14_0_8_um_filter_41_23]|nr:arginine--tRNA ligase [Nitrospirota bacterium]OIP59271.1 MAG: arginine--tRNA ligase [Nitrospirae bacterium CG2_30_41_42]PIQ94315.1 MAG: arginine--tRNA ligase [Nitrospirae bacterium CG11_big_fil_rev_8_21_14_0_20_41_14]PIV44180.1 MAG: arginine--tRNA ligase [Nitrospirae bacterium CG02_land_8_20_14_3_00_41_53]PIW87307.1 MAG: arginine--tRNA ligase [Nitrospirae bacterium CG_4_8_14_3_um_filter_41_47]PIY86800.1 MAG: arginine--tRNA ligase [Nitrospirae bacterium CG_4_10_14_0_8_um_filter_41_23]PJA794